MAARKTKVDRTRRAFSAEFMLKAVQRSEELRRVREYVRESE